MIWGGLGFRPSDNRKVERKSSGNTYGRYFPGLFSENVSGEPFCLVAVSKGVTKENLLQRIAT